MQRLKIVFIITIIVFVVIWSRLAWLQIFNHKAIMQKADQIRNATVIVYPNRKNIYDRKGEIMATNIIDYDIYLMPDIVKKKNKDQEVIKTLSEILKIPEQLISEKLNKYKFFVYLQKHIPYQLMEKIKAQKLPGIGFENNNIRYYPNQMMASNVLGYAGEFGGNSGIELYYNKILQGKPGKKSFQKSATGELIPQTEQVIEKEREGTDIYLTLDRNIQFYAEEVVEKAISINKAEKALAIVMNPYNGEILALANRPGFNPNNKITEKDLVNMNNLAVNYGLEPGSTFKIVTMVAGLEEGIITPNTPFIDNGIIEVKGGQIKNWNYPQKAGNTNFKEVITQSMNTGMVWLGLKLGQEKLYQYIKKFGFGEKTGVDLPGEIKGILLNDRKKKLSEIEIGAVAIGQSNLVTPIQIIRSIAVIANGGYLVKPHLLYKKGGETVNYPVGKKIISNKTTNIMKNLLENVVVNGSGHEAYLYEYSLAGKTGTAQKIVDGKYSDEKYVASFVGFAPVDKPKIAVLVVVDSPQGVYYGGLVAAPLAKELVRNTLNYLNVDYQYNLTEQQKTKFDESTKKIISNIVNKIKNKNSGMYVIDNNSINLLQEKNTILVETNKNSNIKVIRGIESVFPPFNPKILLIKEKLFFNERSGNNGLLAGSKNKI